MKNIANIQKVVREMNDRFPTHKSSQNGHDYFAIYNKEKKDWTICVINWFNFTGKGRTNWLKILSKKYNVQFKTELSHEISERLMKKQTHRYIHVL
jgi:hypothetical protein